MDILVIGTGGLAREFSDWFASKVNIIGYSSQSDSEHKMFNMRGKLFTDAVTPDLIGTKFCVMAIGRPKLKRDIYEKYVRNGFVFPSLVHESSIVSASANLESGVIISPKCVVGLGVHLGAGTYLNFGVNIGHESVIGDFSHVNPGANIAGECKVGSQVLVGSGSTVVEKKQLGDLAVVASGSVVFNSVRQGATVMGNPARRMKAFS